MPDDDNEDSIMVIETAVSLKTHGCLLLFVNYVKAISIPSILLSTRNSKIR